MTKKKRKKFEIRIYLNIDIEGTDHSACILSVDEVNVRQTK